MKVVRLTKGKSKVVAVELSHDQVDAPASLAFVRADGQERMVSGGGKIVKVWEEVDDQNGTMEEEDGEESPEDVEDQEVEDSSDEAEKQRKKRKRRKKDKSMDERGNHGVMAFKGMD